MRWQRVCLTVLMPAAGACAADNVRTGESPAEFAVRLAAEHDAAYVVELLNELEETRGEEYAIDGDDLTGAGYRQLMSGQIEISHVVQKAATTMFPDLARAWGNLGEVAIYLGDRELAQRSFERALAIDSTNDARWRLPRLDAAIQQAAAETKVLNMFEPGSLTGLDGPYFGQAMPGTVPEVFAPGIVSTRGGHEFSCTFSPDGREFYFNRGPNIYVAYWREDGWTAPDFAPFNSDRLDHEPFIPTDGSKLYFGSGRERAGVSAEEAYGIWVMEREGDVWGEPAYLFPGMFVTTASSGNAYVTSLDFAAGGGLCVYRPDHGGYGECERLEVGVDSRQVAHPLIAPDESFLIFDAQDGDLYISFPLGDGGWSPGVRIDEISDIGEIMTAALSPDAQVLFFYANHDIYWVSAGILRPYVVASRAVRQ